MTSRRGRAHANGGTRGDACTRAQGPGGQVFDRRQRWQHDRDRAAAFVPLSCRHSRGAAAMKKIIRNVCRPVLLGVAVLTAGCATNASAPSGYRASQDDFVQIYELFARYNYAINVEDGT